MGVNCKLSTQKTGFARKHVAQQLEIGVLARFDLIWGLSIIGSKESFNCEDLLGLEIFKKMTIFANFMISKQEDAHIFCNEIEIRRGCCSQSYLNCLFFL